MVLKDLIWGGGSSDKHYASYILCFLSGYRYRTCIHMSTWTVMDPYCQGRRYLVSHLASYQYIEGGEESL